MRTSPITTFQKPKAARPEPPAAIAGEAAEHQQDTRWR